MSVEASIPRVAQQLGTNLRRLRAQAEQTQLETAGRAGMARSHYAALEAGSNSSGGVANPRLSTLIGLAQALDATLADVLHGLCDDDAPR